MKTTYLQVRVSPEQKEYIRSQAARAHQEMSEWILARIVPDARAKFLHLLSKLKSVEAKKERHYALNDLSTFLSRLSDHEFKTAVFEPHEIQLNNLMDNYVAAI